MLFMSEMKKDITVRNRKDVYSQKSGEKVGTVRRVSAEFRRGGVPDWALPKALEVFNFSGKPDGIEERHWLCVYDSVADQFASGWDDEERELIEEKLSGYPGVHLIEPERVEAPWPAYDKLVPQGRRTLEHVVEKIVDTIRDLELDPGRVAAYERENQNRPEVVAAVEALLSGAREDEAEPLIAA